MPKFTAFKVSRQQQHRAGELRWSLTDFLSWGEDTQSTGTQKQLEYLRQETQGRELLRENPRDLGGLLVIPSSALSMYVRTRSETKDRAILKSNREQCPALTQHRMETVPTT